MSELYEQAVCFLMSAHPVSCLKQGALFILPCTALCAEHGLKEGL